MDSNLHNITIHSAQDLEKMHKAGRLAALILDFITEYVKPGIETNELNKLCHNKIIENGAIPAPLNYRGFPKSICTSVNHVICHGIPSDKKLQHGDILNIDVTVILDGWHGDTSRMYFVGDKISIKAKRLTEITYNAMMKGIDVIKPGIRLNEIGRAIQEYVEDKGYSVVRDYCGHGIGKIFHTAPNVLHYYEPKNQIIIEEGMFFTIEPMINAGSYKTRLLNDNWTVVTQDNSLSAQFEHTLGVTKNGIEIFTLSPKGYTYPPYNR